MKINDHFFFVNTAFPIHYSRIVAQTQPKFAHYFAKFALKAHQLTLAASRRNNSSLQR